MAKKRKEKMNDRAFGYLLKDYERSSLSPEEKAELVSMLKAPADPAKGAGRGLSGLRAGVMIAAAAALVLVFGLALFLYRAPLANTYTLTSDGQGELYSKAGKVSAPTDEEVELLSGSELVVLSPGTELTVKGSPLRRLTGKKENTYALIAGDVYIEHSGGSFRLETRYGIFSPAGTVISCSSAPDLIVLTCLEGRMKIEPNNGDDFFLGAGWVLTAERTEGVWLTGLSKIPAVFKHYLPAERTGGKQPEIREDPPAAAAEAAATAEVAEVVEAAEAGGAPVWTRAWRAGSSGLLCASLAEERLFIFDGGSLSSFDFISGEILSGTPTGQEYKFSSLYENIFFGYSGSRLEALDAGNGELIWSLDDAPVCYAGFTVEDGKLYLPSVDGRLYIYAADDGSGPTVIESGAGLYGLPAAAGGAVVFSSIDKRISFADSSDGRLLWQVGTADRLMGDKPVLTGGSVLLSEEGGRLILLDSMSGESIAEGDFSPPMAVPPVAAGQYFIYQDAGGIKIADAAGLELIGSAGGPRLIASGTAGESAAFITDEGFSVIEGGIIKTKNYSIIGGVIIGGSALIMTADGEIEKWSYR